MKTFAAFCSMISPLIVTALVILLFKIQHNVPWSFFIGG